MKITPIWSQPLKPDFEKYPEKQTENEIFTRQTQEGSRWKPDSHGVAQVPLSGRTGYGPLSNDGVASYYKNNWKSEVKDSRDKLLRAEKQTTCSFQLTESPNSVVQKENLNLYVQCI